MHQDIVNIRKVRMWLMLRPPCQNIMRRQKIWNANDKRLLSRKISLQYKLKTRIQTRRMIVLKKSKFRNFSVRSLESILMRVLLPSRKRVSSRFRRNMEIMCCHLNLILQKILFRICKSKIR